MISSVTKRTAAACAFVARASAQRSMLRKTFRRCASSAAVDSEPHSQSENKTEIESRRKGRIRRKVLLLKPTAAADAKTEQVFLSDSSAAVSAESAPTDQRRGATAARRALSAIISGRSEHSVRSGKIPSAASKDKNGMLEVRAADFAAFENALRAQDRVDAWLKFRDVCFDPAARKMLRKEHFVDLMRIYAKNKNPKISDMYEIVEIACRSRIPGLPDSDLYAPLIRALATVGDAAAIRNVLGEMNQSGIRPDAAIYNQLLRVIAKSSGLANAEIVLSQMASAGIQPDHESYEILISAALTQENLPAAQTLHARMIEKGIAPQQNMHATLIRMHFMAGETQFGIDFFRSMTNGTLPSSAAICGCLIRGFSESGHLDLAQEVVDWMATKNIFPDPGAFSPLVEARVASDDLEGALSILKHMEDVSDRPDMQLYYSIVSAACKFGFIDEALRICDGIRARGFKPTLAMHRVVMNAYIDAGRTSDAYNLFEQIQAEGYELNISIYNTMLRAAAVDLDVDLANKIWTVVNSPETKVGADPETYKTLLGIYVAAQDVKSSTAICEAMIRKNIHPSSESLFQLINSAVLARRYDAAAQAIMIMRRFCGSQAAVDQTKSKSIESTDVNLASLVNEYHKEFDALILSMMNPTKKSDGPSKRNDDAADLETAQSVDQSAETSKRHTIALELYRTLSEANVVPTEAAMRAIMGVYHRQGDLIGVVKVWTSLQKAYSSPSADSVAALLSAASDLGQKRTAQAIRTMIEKEKLPLNQSCFESLITFSARCGIPEGVFHTMLDMVNAGVAPTPNLYRAILGALDRAVPRQTAARKDIMNFIEEQFPEIIVNEEDGDDAQNERLASVAAR